MTPAEIRQALAVYDDASATVARLNDLLIGIHGHVPLPSVGERLDLGGSGSTRVIPEDRVVVAL